jgi:DNA-binding CsgD family transcriptional regulator
MARQIGSRLVHGYSLTEIAGELGTSPRSVSKLLAELRDELVSMSG